MTDKTAAVKALSAPLQVPYADDSHILRLPHATRIYKTLLAGGHFDSETSSVEIVDSDLRSQFAQAVWLAITSEEAGGESNLRDMVLGDVAFVLIELINALKDEQKVDVSRILGGSVDQIRAGTAKGSSALADLLDSL